MFNLRGNGRTSGERCRQEGEPLFAAHGGTGGSLTPIAITLLVKKPNYTGKAQIYYHDIGMYLKRKEKLARLAEYKSILSSKVELTSITPNEAGDWINKRSKVFETYIPIGDKKNPDEKTVFTANYSCGVKSNRDTWVYNFSQSELDKNISSMIDFYNENLESSQPLQYDSTKISWSDTLKQMVAKGIKLVPNYKACHAIGMYRPFCKQNFFYYKPILERTYQMLRIFPTPQSKNLVICVPGVGSNKDFSAIIVDCIPDIQLQFNGQCFPLYWYEKKEDSTQRTLFDVDEDEFIQRSGISDFMLERCRNEFGYKTTKEDVFYYVYGLFHSKQYKEKFAADLKKTLPRIPLVRDFWTFSKMGRNLAELHLNYENLKPPNFITIEGVDSNDFRVEKCVSRQKENKIA